MKVTTKCKHAASKYHFAKKIISLNDRVHICLMIEIFGLYKKV